MIEFHVRSTMRVCDRLVFCHQSNELSDGADQQEEMPTIGANLSHVLETNKIVVYSSLYCSLGIKLQTNFHRKDAMQRSNHGKGEG